MIRTLKLKLHPTPEQSALLTDTMREFNRVCGLIAPIAQEHRCWNRVALQHICYYSIREQSSLGSQMICQAIKCVCDSYKSLKSNGKIKKGQPVPDIVFNPLSSVPYDHRTYSLKNVLLSLNTITDRIKVPVVIGDFHRPFMAWTQKSADLCFDPIKKRFYFHLVVETDTPEPSGGTDVLGVDLGENNVFALSTGRVVSGAAIRDRRDRFLTLRKRLQSKGTDSAKRHLHRLSGKENRWMSNQNHIFAKSIVREAQTINAGVIVMEGLTGIRNRIRARKRVRTRLHRWSFLQLQTFVAYKAEAVGIKTETVNPAYTSQTCASCGALGIRSKHLFACPSCKSRLNADVNAAINLVRVFTLATGRVNARNVIALSA